jgi:DNA-binding IclR family transcriptional regulator
LQRKVIWPTELATLQDFRMHLRDTTRHLSSMVIDGEVVGRSIPLLSTALGLAYLSRCDPRRRQALLGLSLLNFTTALDVRPCLRQATHAGRAAALFQVLQQGLRSARIFSNFLA